MPIPKPKNEEPRWQFIKRCVDDETMKREYPNNEQRVAVCYSQWENK